MKTYFVTRHAGAVDWARRQGHGGAVMLAHLDGATLAGLQAGDVVIGTLPVNLVAEAGRRGARYFHLVLDLPAEARGRDIGAQDMEVFGARLEEYRAERIP